MGLIEPDCADRLCLADVRPFAQREDEVRRTLRGDCYQHHVITVKCPVKRIIHIFYVL